MTEQEKKERATRAAIKRGLKKLGRDAVTVGALFTLGKRYTRARKHSGCGCFIGETILGLDGAFDKAAAEGRDVSLARAVLVWNVPSQFPKLRRILTS
jgi:hypothetical protein